MSRFSPTVLPDSGPRFDPETIARAIDMFQREQENEADRAVAADLRTEAKGDRATARERGTERYGREKIGWEREDDRFERTEAREDVADYQSGIRVGDSPLAHRISEAADVLRDPSRAVSGRIQIPGFPGATLPASATMPNNASAQGPAAAEGRYVDLAGDRYLDLEATPDARATQAASARGNLAAGIGETLGAGELAEAFRLNPELLADYIEHGYSTEINDADNSASLERTRLQQDRIDARNLARTRGEEEEIARPSYGQAYDMIIDSPQFYDAEGNFRLSQEEHEQMAGTWAMTGATGYQSPPRPPEGEAFVTTDSSGDETYQLPTNQARPPARGGARAPRAARPSGPRDRPAAMKRTPPPADEPPADEAPSLADLPPTEVQGIRDALTGLPDEAAATILREQGFSDDDISALLGG